MAFSMDAVAGVADLFGALPRDQLERGLVELAYRRGDALDSDDAAALVEQALSAYALVAVGEKPLLAPGPAAFPQLPTGAEDLPHILDVERRDLDRERIAAAAAERFRDDVADALAADDTERIEHLLDISYDLEAWGPVEVADSRDRLDERL